MVRAKNRTYALDSLALAIAMTTAAKAYTVVSIPPHAPHQTVDATRRLATFTAPQIVGAASACPTSKPTLALETVGGQSDGQTAAGAMLSVKPTVIAVATMPRLVASY